MLQRPDVQGSKTSGNNTGVGDIADLHIVVCFQRDRDDVLPVQLFINDAAADRIAVQTDQEVKQCRTVADHDIFPALPCAEDFFGVVERIMFALLIGKPGLVFQILQCQGFSVCQRTESAEKYMGPSDEKTVEIQGIFPQVFPDDRFIEWI